MQNAHTCGCAILAIGILCAGTAAPADQPERSPFDVAFSPDGRTLAVTDHTAGIVTLADVAEAGVRRAVKLDGRPAGVAWSPNGSRLYAAECRAGTIAEIDPATGRVTRSLAAGAWPLGVAIAGSRDLLVVADFPLDTVVLLDLTTGEQRGRLRVPRRPFAVAITPDAALAAVSNLLPDGPATDPGQSAAVTLIDLERRTTIADIRLPAGSSCARGIAIGPGGRRAYVVHNVGRTNLPTTQIERGWVNTNGLSVIDLESRRRVATVLLDFLLEGAADPWGIAIAPDGSRLWVTIAGTHQLATIDLIGLSALLAEGRRGLEDDIAALSRAGVIRRTKLPGKGPRGLAVSPDGRTLAVAMYFSGRVVLLDADTAVPTAVVALGDRPEPDAVRRGEQIFHDATYSKQGWLSCSTCHPDGRADGMNWDLLNDGLGNPKNVRSLLWVHKTPPMMSRGVRPSMEAASAAGFRRIAFREIDPAALEDVQAYLRSLEPVSSPYAGSDGPLVAQIERGREIFNREDVACAECHPAPLYTNLRLFDVGTRGALDRSGTFDTPTLVELWRTAPYLHDGSAATLREVLFDRNKDDRHGRTSPLSEQEIEDLIVYLLSL